MKNLEKAITRLIELVNNGMEFPEAEFQVVRELGLNESQENKMIEIYDSEEN